MNKILCSSGAILGKANHNDYELLGQFAKEFTCDGFELMIGRSWYSQLDEMIETVKSFGLFIPVIHANKMLGEYLCGMTRTFENGAFQEYFMTDEEEQELFDRGTELYKLNLKAAKELQAEKMVLHLWNGVPSDRRLDNNIKRFGAWKKMADEAGVDLLVENVICNVNDPLSNMNWAAATRTGATWRSCRSAAAMLTSTPFSLAFSHTAMTAISRSRRLPSPPTEPSISPCSTSALSASEGMLDKASAG